LSSGLDQILRRFEVVDVRNYFKRPARNGARFVEVLLIIPVQKGPGEKIPHVCELRLEEAHFHKALEKAAVHEKEFRNIFLQVYDRPVRDHNSIAAFARTMLNRPVPAHDIRIFLRHFAKRYGSTISGWRKEFGGSPGCPCRYMKFSKFKDVCQKMGYGERAAEFFQELDSGLGGAITIFDFDAEACSMLVRLRTRLFSMADTATSGDKWSDDRVTPNKLKPETVFERLSYLVRPNRPGRLEWKDFRTVMKPLGIERDEANRLFDLLECAPNDPPAAITVDDIAWVVNLPEIMDVQAVMMTNKANLTAGEELRHITWSRNTSRYQKQNEILRWSIFEERQTNVSVSLGSHGVGKFKPHPAAGYAGTPPRSVTPPLQDAAILSDDYSGGEEDSFNRSKNMAAPNGRQTHMNAYYLSDDDEESDN
jgi:hypothetical protein